MRKLLLIVIGLVLLAAAAVTLWTARGPQSTEAATTGGVLYSQQEIADSGTTDLSTVTDTGYAQPLSPALAPNVSADLQYAESAEIASAPETVAELESAPPPASLTTDIVIESDSEIEVAPIAVSEPNPPPGEQGGGMTTIMEGAYEQRVVELEWPAKFQVGRSGSLRVKLKVLDSGALQPVAEIADNEIIATPILITNRYETHDAFVTLTVSAPDFDTASTSPATQQMFPGGEVEWRWTLKADDAQTAVISLGMTISWQPKPGVTESAPQNVSIWGQTLQVEVVYVFGLITVPQASIAGTALGLVGLIAQYPLLEKFLEIFLDSLFGRERRDDRQQQQSRQSRRTDNNRRNRRY